MFVTGKYAITYQHIFKAIKEQTDWLVLPPYQNVSHSIMLPLLANSGMLEQWKTGGIESTSIQRLHELGVKMGK